MSRGVVWVSFLVMGIIELYFFARCDYWNLVTYTYLVWRSSILARGLTNRLDQGLDKAYGRQ